MQTRRTLSTAVTLTIAGLVGNAAGIWIQALSGAADYAAFPIIPPGPIILIIVAAGIGFARRRWWPPIVGALLSLLIIVGAFVRPGTAERLGHPEAVGEFVGTVIQVIALAVGAIAGIVATVQNFQRRTTT